MENLLENRKVQIGLAFILPLITVLLIHNLVIGLALISAAVLFYTLSDEVLIPFTLFAFLIFTSDVSETIRPILTLVILTWLTFKYVNKLGLTIDFNLFPKSLYFLFGYLITVLLISGFINSAYINGITFAVKSLVFLSMIFIYTALSQELKNSERNFLLVLIIAALVLSISVLIEFYKSGIGFIISNVVIRYGGIYSNINAAGVLLSTAVPVIVFFLSKEKHQASRIFYFVLLAIISVSLIITNSRASILAAAIGTLIYLFLINRKLLKRLLLFSSLFVVILILFTPIYDLISTVLRFERIVNTRSYIWDIAYDIISNNIIFGVGPGMFPNFIYKYLPVMLGTWDEQSINFVYSEAGLGHAHNFFLFYFSELGLLGLLFTVAFAVLFYNLAFRYFNKFKGSNYTDFRITALAISLFTGALARGIFESIGIFSYGWIERDLPLWIVLAVFFSTINKNRVYAK
ncbi:MAG: O-antigen ligase family protein [Melioribacteraceae bacterium]|nr:O-antigen ligase family protein [Melioribacteraceae bacterium]